MAGASQLLIRPFDVASFLNGMRLFIRRINFFVYMPPFLQPKETPESVWIPGVSTYNLHCQRNTTFLFKSISPGNSNSCTKRQLNERVQSNTSSIGPFDTLLSPFTKRSSSQILITLGSKARLYSLTQTSKNESPRAVARMIFSSDSTLP